MKTLVSALFPLAALVASAADVTHLATVSNVSFTQNANQDVVVTYDLANDGQPAFITLDVLTNGVPLPVAAVQTVSGDVSSSLADFIADGTMLAFAKESYDVTDAILNRSLPVSSASTKQSSSFASMCPLYRSNT